MLPASTLRDCVACGWDTAPQRSLTWKGVVEGGTERLPFQQVTGCRHIIEGEHCPVSALCRHTPIAMKGTYVARVSQLAHGLGSTRCTMTLATGSASLPYATHMPGMPAPAVCVSVALFVSLLLDRVCCWRHWHCLTA